MKPRWRIALLTTSIVFILPHVGAEDVHVAAKDWNCGTFSSYQLLGLEGHHVDLERLKSLLGEMPSSGYSFRELTDGAGRYGVTLDALVIPKDRSAIRQPLIMFLKKESEGHFVVVRPVGHTGTLLQMIGGEREPSILEAKQLFESKSWKGLALVPRRTNPLSLILVASRLYVSPRLLPESRER